MPAARGSLVAALFAAQLANTQAAGWPHYGGDAGGTRYSAAAQITPANVDGLPAKRREAGGNATARNPGCASR
ncbi:MAG: hypothetical protein ABIO45_08745 [Burkholderiaceae bacterium]